MEHATIPGKMIIMMNIQVILRLTLLALFIIPAAQASESDGRSKLKSSIIVLSNAQMEAEILPYPGGRLIAFKKNGGKNILLFTPALLEETESMVPAIDAVNPSDKAYYGFEVWLAPQSERWTHQNLNNAKKESRSPWPSDPYHAYGRYRVTGKTNQSVTLEGPESPITGVKLVKQYTLLANGVLNIKITAINIRNEPLRWGIWTNTRLSGEANSYAGMKISSDGSAPVACKFFTSSPERETILPFKIHKNFFTFDTSAMPLNKTSSSSNKAFILCSDGILAAFHDNLLLLKSLRSEGHGAVHREHAKAEIFQSIPAGGQPLLELEFCGNETLIKPGSAITLEENWKLLDYHGGKSIEEQVSFLQKILHGAD